MLEYADALDWPGLEEYKRGWQIPLLHGTKIGGYPAFIQPPSFEDDPHLCTLWSQQPDDASPFTNVERGWWPPHMSFNENFLMLMDVGAIYFLVPESRKLVYELQSY
ncbi:MAG: hypothetical protein FLDDKLPJ_01243 [Phycisphaerae bacterium]|nr:hypothetical protein [Phycisphaerae bacterium]